ncbi:MAG: hypothetical protein MJK18_05710 [Bdellovibrionales bacterium]|nr:hypothetical protein [Bdellovibrionales bacterium]
MNSFKLLLIILLVQAPIKITFAQTMRMAPPPPPPQPRSKFSNKKKNQELIKSQREQIKKLKEENEKLRAQLKAQGKSVDLTSPSPSVAQQTEIKENSATFDPSKVSETSSLAAQPVSNQPSENMPTQKPTAAEKVSESLNSEKTQPAPVKKKAKPISQKKKTVPPVAKKKVKKRKAASVAFKSGMHKFKKKCTMFTQPNKTSSPNGVVKAGRKLWVDGHNANWRKAYKKSGTVYIHKSCL